MSAPGPGLTHRPALSFSKGQKDRKVVLPPGVPELLRKWWRAARPEGRLFPGKPRIDPMSRAPPSEQAA